MKKRKKHEGRSDGPGEGSGSDLSAALDRDEANRRRAIAELSHDGVLALYDRLSGLFEGMLEEVGKHYKATGRVPIVRKASNGSEVHAFDFSLRFYMALSARQQLIFATSHMVRGHLAEAAPHTRRAIECAGIAYLSKSEADLGDLYVSGDRKEFAKRTAIGKILPPSEPRTADLHAMLDTASNLMRDNFMSIVGKIEQNFAVTDTKWSLNLKLYNHEAPDDFTHFIRVGLWILRAGERILKLLATSFELPDSPWHRDLESFEQDLGGIYGRLDDIRKSR
jgi:hypothetical protein